MKKMQNIPTSCRYSSIYDNVEYNINITQLHSTEATIEIKCAKNRGYSIANAIRREILVSAESFAICAIRIHGVNHEYSSIKGVVNQISEIIANLKKVIIVANSSLNINNENKHNVYGAILHHSTTNNKDTNIVTASHISLPEHLTILNPTQEICRLDINSQITIDLAIIYGQGFISQEHIKYTPALSNDYIKIDTNFANNVKVSIQLNENTRSLTTDTMIINITTSLAHNALELYHKAVKSFLSLINVLHDTSVKYQHEITTLNSGQYYHLSEHSNDVTLQSLAIKGIMTYRIYSALNKYGITNIKELANLSEQKLLLIEGIGQSAIIEIKKLMHEFKLELNNTIDDNILGKRQVHNVMDENMIGTKNPNLVY